MSKFHLSLHSWWPNISSLYQHPNYYWYSKFLYPRLLNSPQRSSCIPTGFIFLKKLVSNRLCNMPAMCSLFPWNGFSIHRWTHGCIFHSIDVLLTAALIEKELYLAPNFGRKSNSLLESAKINFHIARRYEHLVMSMQYHWTFSPGCHRVGFSLNYILHTMLLIAVALRIGENAAFVTFTNYFGHRRVGSL